MIMMIMKIRIVLMMVVVMTRRFASKIILILFLGISTIPGSSPWRARFCDESIILRRQIPISEIPRVDALGTRLSLSIHLNRHLIVKRILEHTWNLSSFTQVTGTFEAKISKKGDCGRQIAYIAHIELTKMPFRHNSLDRVPVSVSERLLGSLQASYVKRYLRILNKLIIPSLFSPHFWNTNVFL